MARVMQVVLDVMSGPFVWGVSDCCISASDVFQRLHGCDPMAALRGRYASARGAARLIRAAGGFDALCDAQAAACGLRPGTGAPGEIGLFDFGVGARGLAICTAPGVWQGKAPQGTAPVRAVRRMWCA